MPEYLEKQLQLLLLIMAIFIGFVQPQRQLPDVVRLGSAVVAAVEEDAAQEALKLATQQDDPLEKVAVDVFSDAVSAAAARGKYHKQKKMLKYIYPLVMGVLLAKTVLIPLMLKLLTAISTSSFVMSKISLAASALLALKWIIGSGRGGEAKERLEIIHLPVVKGIGATESSAWSDSAWSGSHVYEKSKKLRHNYIPIVASKDISSYSTSSTYRYPQHNYQAANYDGKPFL